MKKTLIIKELKSDIVLRVRVETARGHGTREVARFSKCGMGYVTLGAAGRSIINAAMVDQVQFDGELDTYKMLVGLGVIEPQDAAA